MFMRSLSLPIRLTLIRLIVSPLILPVLFVYLLPCHSFLVNSCLALLFALLSLTDFFDGYLARKYNQETVIGRILDPLADKFLVYCTLIALLAAGKLFFYWVIILIGREFFVMGLRHIALEHGLSLPVSKLSKLKTAVQMICLTIIILNPSQPLGVQSIYWNGAETGLLLITVVLSLITAGQYYDEFMMQFSQHSQDDNPLKEISHDSPID